MSRITIFTISQRRGVHNIVITRLKPVWALAICLEITSISGPLGEIILIISAKGVTNQINRKLPDMLKMEWASAVLLASLG